MEDWYHAQFRFTTFETLIGFLDDRAFDMVSIGYTGETFSEA